MTNEKIMVEFTQDELDDLIEELINVSDLLEKGEESIKKEYENRENGDIYFRVYKSRIKSTNDMLEKLLPLSDFYSASVEE